MGRIKGVILKPMTEPKPTKVNFNKNGSGYTSAGRVTLSKNILATIGITEDNPFIEYFIKDSVIIIKAKDGVCK